MHHPTYIYWLFLDRVILAKAKRIFLKLSFALVRLTGVYVDALPYKNKL